MMSWMVIMMMSDGRNTHVGKLRYLFLGLELYVFSNIANSSTNHVNRIFESG